MSIDRTSVTGIIDRLVQQRLVNRTEDVRGRHYFILRATNQGEEFAARLRSQSVSYPFNVLYRMNLNELSGMAKGLAAFLESAEEELKG